MQAPDFPNGHATIGNNKPNSWRTDIRSVLILNGTTEGESRVAYLTHECRAENISDKRIFDGRLYEFMVIKTWEGVFNLRHGSFNFGTGGKVPSNAYEASDLDVDVCCPLVTVNELSFEEALALCRRQGPGRLFMRIDYDLDGRKWTAYAPARYVNFQNDRFPGKQYMQPISGYTLIYCADRFRIAYAAAYVDESGAHIEFILRTPLPFLKTKHPESRVRKLLSPFTAVFDRLLRTDEFHELRAPTGQIRFFTYPDGNSQR